MWANQRKYEGCWREGMMSGSGVFTWPTGQFCKYEGQFAKGHKEGKGTLYVRDGRRYSGNFHNNLMDGEVYEVMPSGRRRKGEHRGEGHLGCGVDWLLLFQNKREKNSRH